MEKLQSFSTLQLARVPMPMCSDTVLCDTLTETPHPYVPEDFRRTVFDSLHCLSHSGVQATQRLVTPGLESTQMSVSGFVPVYNVKEQKSTITPLLHWLPLLHQMHGLTRYTSTLLVPCHHHRATST